MLCFLLLLRLTIYLYDFVEFLTVAGTNIFTYMFKEKMTTEHVEKLEAEEEVEMSSESGSNEHQMVPWIFTRRDQLALLQAVLDFASARGDPSKHMDLFCDYVKDLVFFDTSKSHVVKIRVAKLKRKFEKDLERCFRKGKSEENPIVFPTSFDEEAFELSRKIWGKNGVLDSKLSTKLKGKLKEISSSHEVNVASTRLTSGREIASLFKSGNMLSFGLDEATVIARWDKLEDGPKKRALDTEFKKIQDKEMECLVMRTGLMFDVVKAMATTMHPHNR